MNWIKLTRVAAAVLTLSTCWAADAAAQAPVLSASANGQSVSIEWTSLAGALGYNIQAGTAVGASDVASVNLPASITRIVVTAPVGTYYLRVRGITLTAQGPFSNEASVTVQAGIPAPGPGPGPCEQPGTPSASAKVTGGGVTINWTGVAGAAGYRLEFSRTPGTTELVQNVGPGQTTFTQHIGILGTFSVRVVAGNACGTATSQEVSFTIDALTSGSGPRSPNPPPGGLLPLPSYGQGIVQQIAATYRGDLLNSCREHGGNNTYLFRVLAALRQRDSRWGLNDKRGQAGDTSQDIITFNPTDRPDNGESQVYLVDVISSHCGDPDWNWADVTDVTWAAAGHPACGTPYCARWSIDAYLRAGFPADPRE